MLIFFSVLLLVIGFFAYRHWSKTQARNALLAAPLSDHQRRVIDAQVPLIRRLPKELRAKLDGKVNLFLDQVRFFGCDGLDVTEEMELAIAAQASLLLVNRDIWYDNLTTILIYPTAFKSRQRRQDGYVISEKEIVRTGESWDRGPVILSWTHSQQGALNDRDGQNVVLHEFAHQVDDLSGGTNGVPILSNGQSFAEWERVFLTAYDAHVSAVEHGRHTVIDPYGATGHEEFFAVSVEVFFERPVALKSEAPEVYEQLAKLFQLDPASWT
ncbi:MULTISPECIES: M90 family metallopeptidase [unclassified Ruegeria]|uniref:M90 family metallopeptidase n=1 Tax=unclassified Ruegeria TaxID=2625375 RepID=UPI001ADB64E5|nr:MULTISPECIES: M90 family metallopeptidase [unclassified Ruegeria]MBO9410413.1 zinc-dependent peptidase [Ruegeria sp. R8_1]MBO9414368.1 zinc-dependent peptidase [Ruegeria sp. R8_2]